MCGERHDGSGGRNSSRSLDVVRSSREKSGWGDDDPSYHYLAEEGKDRGVNAQSIGPRTSHRRSSQFVRRVGCLRFFLPSSFEANSACLLARATHAGKWHPELDPRKAP